MPPRNAIFGSRIMVLDSDDSTDQVCGAAASAVAIGANVAKPAISLRRFRIIVLSSSLLWWGFI
jgi:hypothetical protein